MAKREIKALNVYTHVRLRPTMYVGQIAQIDEKVMMLQQNLVNSNLIKTNLIYSPAFYKLYDEVLGNAFDEAITLGGKMKEITISFNSKTNEVEVIDTGGGFYNGEKINPVTNKTNIETAFTELNAGTNFDDTREEETIGTNGMGVSLVNILSDYFEVETINANIIYKQRWDKDGWLKNITSVPTISKRSKTTKTGTKIKFKPDSDLFSGNTWDKGYIHTLMILKEFSKSRNPILKNVKFKCYFDGKLLDLNKNILPENTEYIKSSIGDVYIFPKYDDGTSVSFINGQLCEGTHQRIINEFINDKVFAYQYAHYFYDTIINFSLKPSLVRFSDQNKTKFATGKWDIEPIIKTNVFGKLAKLKGTKLAKGVISKIDIYENSNAKRDLKRAKRNTSSKKLLTKYYPPAKNKDILFISEGLSASGGIIQNRDTNNMGVYALRGKIKNTRKISDLANSDEIVNLMNVLGLELDKLTCSYDKVVIATDKDPDGFGHIASLLINFIYKWFPFIIEQGRLYILDTPIITARVNKRFCHFYSRAEYMKHTNVSEKSYIKGLGSLSERDWKLIFKRMHLYQVHKDKNAEKMLLMAFGTEASLRKKWLEN